MRIIAGQFRSRRLKSVPGLVVRPTPDRLREALFNILAPRLNGTVFLDAYAGSGAVGIEALSRGAAAVVLVEKNPRALAIIRENLNSLQIEDSITVVKGEAASAIGKHAAGIIFIDPPYDQAAEYDRSFKAAAVSGCGLVIAQHPSRMTLSERVGGLQRVRIVKQGDNALSFYDRIEE